MLILISDHCPNMVILNSNSKRLNILYAIFYSNLIFYHLLVSDLLIINLIMNDFMGIELNCLSQPALNRLLRFNLKTRMVGDVSIELYALDADFM